MFKKIFFIFFLFFLLLFSVHAENKCDYDPTTSTKIIDATDSCLNWVPLVWNGNGTTGINLEWKTVSTGWGDLEVQKWFKSVVDRWTNTIAVYLWIFAALMLVYAAFLLVTSWWEDERITKAKGIIKWAIFGVLGIILAASIIRIVISIFYWLS